ncbi:MAG: hypothetical protein JWO38_2281 [Gemmataceae bacterium]|nr:hypothetical protein [Gemmataceae bacterium]
MPTDSSEPRTVLESAARDLLRALADNPIPLTGLRVAEADGGLACLILVWDATRAMPVAGAERRRRAGGGRAGCKEDVVEVVRAANKPLTRKQVLKALRSAGMDHGFGTIAKALADLTAAGELVNPRDKRGYRLPNWPRRTKTPSLF